MLTFLAYCLLCLQCFNAVGWATMNDIWPEKKLKTTISKPAGMAVNISGWGTVCSSTLRAI